MVMLAYNAKIRKMKARLSEVQTHFSYISNLKPTWSKDLVSKTNPRKTRYYSNNYSRTSHMIYEETITDVYHRRGALVMYLVIDNKI